MNQTHSIIILPERKRGQYLGAEERGATPGNVSDCAVAVEVLSSVTISGSVAMGDKAYGTSEIRNYIETSGGSYCIPPKSNTVEPWDCD